MRIKWLREDCLMNLKVEVKKNVKKYEGKNDWLDESWFKEFHKEFPDFELYIKEEEPSETDLENIKILYTNLKELTESQAREERIWAGLCHNQFWNYVQYRWPISGSVDTEEDSILNHYFFKQTGARALMTNALARLWWIGKLTYDEHAENPFILTEYLCKDLAPRSFQLFGTNFSNNKEVLKTFLYTLMDFEKKTKLSREEFSDMIVVMNLWGGSIILDSLSDEELSGKIKNYLNEVIIKERKNSPPKKERKRSKKSKIKNKRRNKK